MVVVVVYLQRVAHPLREFLDHVFGHPAVQNLVRPFDAKNVKVWVLDTFQGLTADIVHVIRGSRQPGAQDQYWGIQSDLRREYIAYTRGRLCTAVWLDSLPFGIPDRPAGLQCPPGDRMRKKQAHAEARNRVIMRRRLPWFRSRSPA